MQKVIVSSLLAVLLVPGSQVFAQFGKNAVKAGANAKKLERTLANLADLKIQPAPKARAVSVPRGIIPGNQALLNRALVKSPEVFNSPVSASLARYIINTPFDKEYLPDLWLQAGGKAFYDDQSALARDLDSFYKGHAQVRVGPDGRTVKLYMLPVDGILYKPAGYNTPVVLDSQDYFVVYDVEAKTGKLAQHSPEAYQVFQLSTYDEIWQAMGASKEFDDLNNLCDAILLAHLHKARVDSMPAHAEIRTLVKEGRSEVYQQLNNQEKLLSYIKKLPKVHMAQRNYDAYMVELPVDGLTFIKQDGTREVYNPKDHIMLFFEMGSSVGVLPRTVLNDPEIFEVPAASKPVAPEKKVSASVRAHPKDHLWAFYEAEKLTWAQDRRDSLFERLWDISSYPRHFESQAELGQTMDSYHRRKVPQIYNKATNQISYVYEIPVKGLTLGGNHTVVDPEKYVVLYNVNEGGQVVKRADVENAVLYKFVE